MLDDLRKKMPIEEFDYLLLMDSLKNYKKPRDKVTQLLNSNTIIRVKKGIYVFGPRLRKGPISLEVLANQIYGPSYISMEYALSFHGMIPERVELITSITSQRSKAFKTPVGSFSYKHLQRETYIVGIDNIQLDQYRYCLMASPEKALADTLANTASIKTMEELWTHLTESLRIEHETLFKLDLNKLKEIARHYKNKNVKLLYETLETKS